MDACDSLICKQGECYLDIIYCRWVYKCSRSVRKEELVNSRQPEKTDTGSAWSLALFSISINDL